MLDLVKMLFRFFEVLPVEKNSRFLNARFKYAIVIFLIVISIPNLVSMVVTLVIQTFVYRSSLETISSHLEVFFLLYANMLKLLTVYWQKDKVLYFIEYVDKHVEKLQQKTLNKSLKITKIIFFLIITGSSLYSLGKVVLNRGTAEQFIFFAAVLPFKLSTCASIIVNLSQFYTGMFLEFFSAIWNSFVISLMICISGQIEYICERIENLEHESDRELTIISMIEHHKELNRVSKNLNDFINPVMTLNLFTATTMVCSVGFQLILTNSSLKSIILLEYITALLFLFFLFYWYSNEMYLTALKLHYATWNSRWYNFNMKEKKLLILTRNFWLHAKYFYVGPFNELRLSTFLGLLRASYSYVMVLKTMHEKNY